MSVNVISALQELSENQDNVNEGVQVTVEPVRELVGSDLPVAEPGERANTGGRDDVVRGTGGDAEGGAGNSNWWSRLLGRVVQRSSGSMREGIKERMREAFLHARPGSVYHSAVIDHRNGERIEEVLTQIRRKQKRNEFKTVIRHDGHLHVLHVCINSSDSCRCFRIKGLKRRHSQYVTVASITKEDIENIVDYHWQCGREVLYISISGDDAPELLGKIGPVSTGSDPAECNSGRDVEVCGCEDQILWKDRKRKRHSSPSQSLDYDSDQVSATTTGREGTSNDETDCASNGTQRRRKRQFGPKRRRGIRYANYERTLEEEDAFQEEIMEFAFKICKVPLTKTSDSLDWINSKFRAMDVKSHSYRNALRRVEIKLSHFRLRDFKHFYGTTETKVWSAPDHERFDETYLPIAQSEDIFMKLFAHNYASHYLDNDFNLLDGWQHEVMPQIKLLMSFLDRQAGKMNTWYIVGPACSGKSLFTDLIKDFFIHTTVLGKWNRNYMFQLQCLRNIRIILWNEPNVEDANEDDLLKLLGGDTLKINVKNTDDNYVEYTPVIVTANKYVFPVSEPMSYRVRTDKWDRFEYIKDIGRHRLHPMTFERVFEHCENYYKEDIRDYNTKYDI